MRLCVRLSRHFGREVIKAIAPSIADADIEVRGIDTACNRRRASSDDCSSAAAACSYTL